MVLLCERLGCKAPLRRIQTDSGITGRRALICGASSGLGLACAQALAAEGVQVTLVSRSEHKLQEAAKQIEASTGAAAKWIAADLSQAADRKTVAAACSDIDILVTNAGGHPSMPFAQLETSHWQAALEQNFLAAVELIQAVCALGPMFVGRSCWAKGLGVVGLSVGS